MVVATETPEAKAEAEAEAARIAALTPEEKAAEEVAVTEAERVAKLTPEELKAEEDAKARQDEKELSLKSQEKVQARIDELIAEKKDLARRLEEIEKKVTSAGEKTYTKEQLISVLQDMTHPEYHAWATVELTKLVTQEQFKGFSQSQSEAARKQESTDKARDEYPEMFAESGEPPTEAWKLADRIYCEKHLDKVEDGQYIAATLAMKQLNKGKETDAKLLQKKLDKENAKKGLASGGKSVKIGETASYEKLRERALKEGPNSLVFKQWQKENVKRQGIKL